MLWQLPDGSYFRGEEEDLPGGEKAKFLMNENEFDRLGRIMAGILRHFPDRFDLAMDNYGWVDIRDMCDAIGDEKPRLHWLRPHHIEAIVATDEKGRYQIDDGLVRATYAHSIDVQLDDLPMSQEPTLYYPVSEEELDMVLDGGLHPTDRKKLHLSGTYESAYSAGQVHMDEPIILAIDAKACILNGIEIRKAGTTVHVAEDIGSEYISRAEEPEGFEPPELVHAD